MKHSNLYYKCWRVVHLWPKYLKYWAQRQIKGYDDLDVWNVGAYAIEKTRPVFKEFARKGVNGCPMGMTFEQWETIIKKIDRAFDLWKENEDCTRYLTPQDYLDLQEGCELFGKHLRSLWD